jgi:hypothetical protein
MTSFKAQGHNLDSRHPGYLLSDRAARTTCRARRAELEANPKALPAFHGPLRSAFTQTDRHHHLEVQPATADYAHTGHGPAKSDRATCVGCHQKQATHQPEATSCKGCHVFGDGAGKR